MGVLLAQSQERVPHLAANTPTRRSPRGSGRGCIAELWRRLCSAIGQRGFAAERGPRARLRTGTFGHRCSLPDGNFSASCRARLLSPVVEIDHKHSPNFDAEPKLISAVRLNPLVVRSPACS